MDAAAGDAGDATVHLRLRGHIGEDELTGLRQQLAACLHSGVLDLRVHADEQDDLDVTVLQALHGVHAYLQRLGGGVVLVGPRPRVLTKLALHGLEGLLGEQDPVLAGGASAPRTPRAGGA